MRTFTVPALLVVAAAVTAAAAACNQSTPLPPLLEDEGDASPPQACAPGNDCRGIEYCIAGPSAGCRYLACIDASWACPPDAGTDAGTDGSAGADASAAAEASADAPGG
jgi:hypothetical protein